MISSHLPIASRHFDQTMAYKCMKVFQKLSGWHENNILPNVRTFASCIERDVRALSIHFDFASTMEKMGFDDPIILSLLLDSFKCGKYILFFPPSCWACTLERDYILQWWIIISCMAWVTKCLHRMHKFNNKADGLIATYFCWLCTSRAKEIWRKKIIEMNRGRLDLWNRIEFEIKIWFWALSIIIMYTEISFDCFVHRFES